ncbi:MAG: SMP-30/gluconolactonase/LRE family protein [Actinomycetota bacterium]|nr:SMP-30/gluconolactonase/LRE family protein [Actinomycetota bacterium]
MSAAETVAAGLGFLEGPVWRDPTGDLIVTVVSRGLLLRVDVESGRADTFAETAGGPNGAYPCQDGGLVVTQNGGIDWQAVGMANPSPPDPAEPGLQRVRPDGSVSPLTGPGDGPFRAPNDLCVDQDLTLWFTDPPRYPPPAEPVGRVWRWSRGGRPEVHADGLQYCNGIGVDGQGRILVVEGHGLMYLDPDGGRPWLIESLPSGGDGFAFDVEGHVYVCGGRSVTVISAEGKVVEQLEAPDGPAIMTNCCFGRDDRRTLFAVDGASGRVLAFPDMPVPGVRLPDAVIA